MTENEAGGIIDALALRIIAELSPVRLVVGLSGGADSTLVLLTACRVRELKPGCEVLAVHCIHGLDADDPVWLDHCTRLCGRLKVRLETPRLNIVYGGGRSPEEVSRAERYRALLDRLQGGVLLLGHQADDQVENFLLALKRGSGPRGLSGMRFALKDARGVIVRPLLELTKQEIEDIIRARGFDFVFDISNTYLKFERNFMRLKVLPLLRERFPGIDAAVRRSQRLCGFEHELAMRYAGQIFDGCYTNPDAFTHILDYKTLDVQDEALFAVIIRLFMLKVCEMPPELALIEAARKLCLLSSNDQQGLVELGNWELRRYRQCLYLIKRPEFAEDNSCYELPIGESLTLGSFSYRLEKCSLDTKGALKVTGQVVELDFSVSGSVLVKPEERRHSRPLKKLYAEYGMPYFLRRAHCVVMSHDFCVLGVGELFSCEAPQTEAQAYRLRITRVS